ncbi:MAG: Holliday junction branch migration protein RuvA [Gammaproteobacteria bacterium]|nr:Holliday junction branch migration protein RuvA [Gammaproteobacteria bacterium]MDH5344297.1 Holliday junction branch migration protein RuvA [Gammaproteobacteria bacterium]
MIGSLRGTLIFRQAPLAIVECGGVGYELEAPMSTFLELPPTGSTIHLFTHVVIREHAHSLYGFATQDEKTLFRMLLTVSGVGAKMALAILSGMSVAAFERCVQLEDSALLIKIPGVGRKTAERLIIEMRDKFDKVPDLRVVAKSGQIPADSRSEAVDALVSLGYKANEVKRLLASIDVADKTAEDIIRLALRKAVS